MKKLIGVVAVLAIIQQWLQALHCNRDYESGKFYE